MKKKCKVVMLATDKKSTVYKLTDNGNSTLHLGDFAHCKKEDNKRTNQHLYITLDDEIKEGDWFLYLSSDTPIVYKCNKTDSAFERQRDECKKIIASTDTTLTNGQLCGTCDNGTMVDSTKRFGTRDCACITTLPQPSQSFIKHFASEYNKGNIITEVMVEYEEKLIPNDSNGGMGYPEEYINILKLNQDNTINIDVVKDSWTKAELLALTMGNSNIVDWIEENL